MLSVPFILFILIDAFIELQGYAENAGRILAAAFNEVANSVETVSSENTQPVILKI